MTDKLPWEKSPHAYKAAEYERLLFGGLECQDSRPRDIAIVGAGMSGLVSGWLLKNAGHRVHFFEASNIVGGRIRTLRDRFTGGFYAEAGAMRIPSHHVLTTKLLDILKLKKPGWNFPNFNANGYFYFNNRHVRMGEYETEPDKLLSVFKVSDECTGKTARQLLYTCLLNHIEGEGKKTERAASSAFRQLATDLKRFLAVEHG